MKLYAPRYYNEFKCKASECSHSCCVGWEICVDDDTLARYEQSDRAVREDIMPHIEDGVITLSEDRRCPFLEENGLCRIISRYGEEYTSRICREHPRFYNYLPDRVELGLGACCEEAARLIMTEKQFTLVLQNEESEAETFCGFDALADRERIFEILSDTSLEYKEKLSVIKERYALSDGLFCKKALCELFFGLEYLRQEDRELFSRDIRDARAEDEIYCQRFFTYLIYRHLSAADSYDSLRARLAFCLALLRLFESLCAEKDPITSAVLISEEIEYSEDNTDGIIFGFECEL